MRLFRASFYWRVAAFGLLLAVGAVTAIAVAWRSFQTPEYWLRRLTYYWSTPMENGLIDDSECISCIVELEKLGRPTVELCIEELRSNDPQRQRIACEVLTFIKEPAADSCAELIRFAKTGTLRVRVHAMHALCEVAPRSPEARQVIQAACDDSEPEIRQAASRMLQYLDGLPQGNEMQSVPELGRN